MKVVLLGAPGSGKGTQAELLCRGTGVAHISTGDLFRDAIHRHTPLGKEAQAYVLAGELVPDRVVIGLVRETLRTLEGQKDFVLEGFPRTLGQAQALSGLLAELGFSLDRAIYLELADSEVVARLGRRRVCSNCGAIASLPPGTSRGRLSCELCGNRMVARKDDRPAAVRRRLQVYHQTVQAVLDYYRESGLLSRVSGAGSPEEVAERVRGALLVATG